MAVIDLRRAFEENVPHLPLQGIRHGADQKRVGQIDLAAGAITGVIRVVESPMDARLQVLKSLAESLRIPVFSQFPGNLLQIRIGLAEGAVVDQVHRFRKHDIHILRRGRPVAQIPGPVIGPRPAILQQQHAVHGVFVYIIQPVKHRRIAAFKQAVIRITHIGAPGRLHDE